MALRQSGLRCPRWGSLRAMRRRFLYRQSPWRCSSAGQQRFNIYCAPCHSQLGDGHGMIVQRGFPAPPSYYIDRLRDAPVQHFYEVITHGYGAMYPYAQRVAPADRWAIIAYIRALQASGNAQLADVPPDKRQNLQ